MSSSTNKHQGMGAIPHDHGVAFRVWAPNAKSVAVVGTFSKWTCEESPLTSEGNGYWYGDMPGAAIGDEYRFELRTDNELLSRIDPCAREVTNSVGNGIVSDPAFDWEGDRFECPRLNECVIYEMHLGSFTRRDKNKPGTFDDAIERLAYLRDLGINAVELMPVAEFAGDFSWGYNVAHPFSVEGAYGGPKGLKRFVKAAHAHGIAVIMDVVYNHFGPSDLSIWRFDAWYENEGGGIYFYNDWRAETPWGMTRPDYGRPEVRQYIFDNAMMWLDDFHLDGLRYDATVYIRNARGPADAGSDLPDGWSLVQWINRSARERFPGKLLIAEDLQNNAYLTKPVEEGGAGFHAQWTANFVHPLRQLLISPLDEHRSMHSLVELLSHTFNNDPFQKVVYSESHDEVANGKARVVQEVDPGNPESWHARKRATLGAAITLTAPGSPMLFQGQEFLTPGWFEDSNPLDWDLAERFKGTVALHRDLIHLRLNRAGMTQGLSGSNIEFGLVDDDRNLVSFHRSHSGGRRDSTVVVVNASSNDARDLAVPFPADGEWKLRFNSSANDYDPEFGSQASDAKAEAGHGSVSISCYSLLIYSQD